MAKCAGIEAAVIAAGGFRLWSLFSAAAIRRKILERLLCGVSRTKRRPMASEPMKKVGSERLLELLMAEGLESGSDEPSEVKKKVPIFDELLSVVTMLQGDDDGRRKSAAIDVRRLAKDDTKSRETLAMLGSIPPLVGMLDSDDPETQIVSLYALLNLVIGNDSNKAAIVNAGAVQKMLRLIESQCSPPVSDVIVANFLGLSALDSNKPIIGSSGAIPFLVSTFQNPNPNPNSTSRQDALKALFNLSISPSNIPNLIAANLPQCLLSIIGDMEVSDRALAVLANLLSTSHGRRAVSRSGNAFPILIDVLYWCDSPACQEKAVYILMIIAYMRHTDRTAMIESGIISSLLELTLLGTPLAEKRASRLLEILTMDKGGKHVSPTIKSEPLDWKRRVRNEVRVSEERKALRCLVEQSLQCNMLRIVHRANLPSHSAPSDRFPTMAPTSSSSSKSLPF
ncbi:Armadillo-like helical-containing protein [Dioscorea alata]|uniref:Armadillo-like helical-containing protein n=5 Tax=Dioscorea alata TaxID=55571 RepID=A0ACB7WJA7_DIOAL|nr:Armadillo-like helical-containing protein [Dioscorea alata]KAH7688325.1 Armadillo-like helical-containing protein [Dioscorea alata]KAH7688326.1 Armadillo-like helical-containing protein [Dioscorea alata]KAH7688327.1 Armadillo-like helical-containing protein [Dioscorea alata]KAH7688328.1 Armadillo-like helical-containing protein [Dioscorea alata]